MLERRIAWGLLMLIFATSPGGSINVFLEEEKVYAVHYERSYYFKSLPSLPSEKPPSSLAVVTDADGAVKPVLHALTPPTEDRVVTELAGPGSLAHLGGEVIDRNGTLLLVWSQSGDVIFDGQEFKAFHNFQV